MEFEEEGGESFGTVAVAAAADDDDGDERGEEEEERGANEAESVFRRAGEEADELQFATGGNSGVRVEG